MPSTTDNKISAQGLLGPASTSLFSAGGRGAVGANSKIILENKKGVAINARKITSLKNITKEQQKQDAGDTIGDKLPGGGGGLTSILGSISSSMEGIKETLIDQNELDVDAAADQRKANEKKKRSLKESALEGIKGTLKKAGDAITKPFTSLWDTVMGFLTTIFMGRIAIKLWEWFADPANTEKITSIFRFIGDWWPAIVAGLIAFASPLLGPVGVIAGIVALVVWGVVKIQDAIKSIFGFGKEVDRELKSGSKKNEKDLVGIETDANKQMDAQVSNAQQGQPDVSPTQTDPKASEGKNFKKGGEVPGTGDKDTVPAMLTPGEFVMSKDAVKQWGTGTLAGMNAAGGGSNSPTMNGDGVMGLRGGGVVPGEDGKEEGPTGVMGGLAGAADWMTGGIFDFDKKGGGLAGMMGGGGGGGNTFARDMVKEHEGLRTDAYKDSKGFLTVGYGHLIDKGSPKDIQELKEGDTITAERAEKLFDRDFKEHADAAKKIPGYGKADEKQQAALIDLTFNMGPDWHADFPKFTAAFKAGNYDLAGAELENSKWYGDVARRAPTIVSLIKGKGLPEGSYLGGKGGAPGLGGPGGGPGGSSATPANVSAPPPVSGINPPTKPSSTVAYAHEHEQQGDKPLPQNATPNLPDFEAGAMVSLAKVKVLGITV